MWEMRSLQIYFWRKQRWMMSVWVYNTCLVGTGLAWAYHRLKVQIRARRGVVMLTKADICTSSQMPPSRRRACGVEECLSETRRQKSSSGEHLQSALPGRTVHSSTRPHSSESSSHISFDPDSEKDGKTHKGRTDGRGTVPKHLKLTGDARKVWFVYTPTNKTRSILDSSSQCARNLIKCSTLLLGHQGCTRPTASLKPVSL